MRYLANTVERFHDRFDFFVVARNHNSRIDLAPLAGVTPDEWVDGKDAKVYYFSRGLLSPSKVAELVYKTAPDAVLLNSVFSTPCVNFLRERRKRGWENIAVILSPCGELLEAALDHKRFKKKVFLTLAKFLGLHRGVLWRASTDRERAEIERGIGGGLRIHVSPDTTPLEILQESALSVKPAKSTGKVRLVFLSRIVPNKNLHLVLRLLAEMEHGEIELEIIGAAEDAAYWSECKVLIEKLPENVKVRVAGAIRNEDALQRLCEAHFFVLPTERENFGYVFIEALSAGCPLIISDRTDWGDIEINNAGWCLPLENHAAWLNTLENCLNMDGNEFQKMSSAARRYAVEWLEQPDREKAALQLFEIALKSIN